MKQVIAFIAVVALAAAALYLAQRREADPAVSSTAIMSAAADLQRDVSRVPMHLTRLPDAQEIRVGDELAQMYRGSARLSNEDKAYERYVNRIGSRVATKAHRPLPYKFHFIPDHAFINAFALPGGHVFIGKGLLDLMTSEDELAAVLGHEIEHIDHYHCAERVQIEAQMRRLDLGVVGALMNIPLQVWQAGYSKDQEMEADREGIKLAATAGYSPYGSIKLLEHLKELNEAYVIRAKTPPEEVSKLTIDALRAYFRSHPLPEERIQQAERVITDERWNNRKELRPMRIEYEAEH